MVSSRTLNIEALGFLFAVIVTVFWQIETNFKEQGIANGGPYDNAASYPRTIAIFIGALLVVQLVTELLRGRDLATAKDIARADLRSAGTTLAVFAVYLAVLTTAGYHLATAPLIFAIMWICGMRNVFRLALASIGIATGFALLFEVFLNVVLPLGIWDIFIPW